MQKSDIIFLQGFDDILIAKKQIFVIKKNCKDSKAKIQKKQKNRQK